MEPRTHARGNLKKKTSSLLVRSLQWSHALTRVETYGTTVGIHAYNLLQWSHALTRVETRLRELKRQQRLLLQWSHALTRVETIVPRRVTSLRLGASMEPRTHARGNLHRAGVVAQDDVGFNGATHSRAWKPLHTFSLDGRAERFNGATHSRAWKLTSARSGMVNRCKLQWSHALTRVETVVPFSSASAVDLLQYRHALTRVET